MRPVHTPLEAEAKTYDDKSVRCEGIDTGRDTGRHASRGGEGDTCDVIPKAMVYRLAYKLAKAAAETVDELLDDVKAEPGVDTLACQNSRNSATPSPSPRLCDW